MISNLTSQQMKVTGLLLKCLRKNFERPACGVTPPAVKRKTKGTGLLSEKFMQNSPTLKNHHYLSQKIKVTGLLSEISLQNLPTSWQRVPPADLQAGSPRQIPVYR